MSKLSEHLFRPEPPEKKIGPWIALVLGCIGLVLIVISGNAYIKQKQVSKWVITTGTVIGFKETENIQDSRKPGRSSAIIEFVDAGGNSQQFISRLSGGDLNLSVQQEVEIIYPENAPEEAEIKHWFAQTGWIIISAGLGIVLCITSWFVRKAF